jgi:hypothetical protein
MNDPALQLGVVTAVHVAGAAYNGSNDLDWWYTTGAGSIDATRTPIDKVPASITAGVLNAGPGSMNFAIALFSDQPTPVRASGVKLQIGIGLSNSPLLSAGTPPGHVAAEHLDPALTSFGAMGTNGLGKLCSNIAAASFVKSSVPTALLPGGQFACSQNYTAANTLLDLLVNGCSIGFVGPVVIPSQPDQVDPSMPVAGAGGPYTFQVNAQKAVSGCLDSSGAAVNLNTCLNAAAYSSYFQLSTDRVILK